MTKAIWPLTLSALRTLIRNKQALYFSLVLPVVIMVVFGLLLGDNTVGDDQTLYRDFLVPGLIALTILQLGVFSVAFLIAQQREKGVLKKLLTTPLRPSDFLGGQILARLIIATTQIFLLLSVAILALSFKMNGSYLAFGVVGLLGATVFLTLGFVVAGLSKSVETVPAIANIIVFPMLLLGDVFFPITSLPNWLESFAALLPVQFVAHAFRQVMLEGQSLWSARTDILGLLVWLLVLFFVAQKVFTLGNRS